jgi:hypothetical protein
MKENQRPKMGSDLAKSQMEENEEGLVFQMLNSPRWVNSLQISVTFFLIYPIH